MSEIHDRKETGRIETFSDSVFAIAVTLLVLGVHVPQPGKDSLGAALIHLWPHYLAFVTSFATILGMWVNHHRIFTFVWRSDHFFLYWNGLLLLLVTFVPFPTTVLAEYFLQPDARVAALAFAGTLFAIALVFKGLWRYASKNGRLLAPRAVQTDVDQVSRQHRYGPVMYAVAFGVSFFSAGLGVALCLCLAVYFGFKGWPSRH